MPSLYNWTYGSAVEPDPFSTLHSTGGNNFAQFNNARMDQLIEEGLQVVSYAKNASPTTTRSRRYSSKSSLSSTCSSTSG